MNLKKIIVLQNIDREGPQLFLKIAHKRGISMEICRLYLNQPIPEIQENDGLLILGGPMGLRDLHTNKFPWLFKETLFLEKAISLSIPMVGVCFGAQLISFISGGNVDKLVCSETRIHKPEIGWSPIRFITDQNEDLVSRISDEPLNVLHWHADRIILPEKAKLLATSERCKEQLFRIGKTSYGIQFHAEIEKKSLIRWINEDREFVIDSLGSQAQLLLISQMNQFLKSSALMRLRFLNGVFDTLWNF